MDVVIDMEAKVLGTEEHFVNGGANRCMQIMQQSYMCQAQVKILFY